MQKSKWLVSWNEIYKRISKLPDGKVFGIPRGGSIIAGMTGNAVLTVDECDYIVDDINDSGKTKEEWEKKTGKKVIPLFDKQEEKFNGWIVFPWESDTMDISDSLINILLHIGEDPRRNGLIDTPKRIIKSWDTIYSGYSANPKEILSRTFDNDEKYDQMVLLKDIEFYSTCEHHMIPFVGKAHIAYIPNGNIVGISKLARLLECFSRRLQVQERLTNQIVDTIEAELRPLGSACVIQAKHFCMCSRGVNKQSSEMITSALRGVFNKGEVRSEFMGLIK